MNPIYLERMKDYLKEDFDKLLTSYEEKPSRSIRLNNIDLETFIKNTKMPLEKIPYDKDGYYLLNEKKYGNHPYAHLGAFYSQEPSAMAPVNILDFKGDERVLDLCASPGGKSGQILRRIPNGLLISNEINYKRALILFENLEKTGHKNCIITSSKPEALSKSLGGFFDVVLVDAPCSGEGMMRKDLDAIKQWSPDVVKKCAERDREILIEADKMLKEDGYLIYSTCTFSKEENEMIVSFLISLGYELIPGSERIKRYTQEGFIKNTYRFYPFTGRGEGQFMALLQKKKKAYNNYSYIKKIKENSEYEIVRKFLKDNITLEVKNVVKMNNLYYSLASNIDLSNANVLNYGVILGEVRTNRFIPHHHLFKAFGNDFKNKYYLDPLDDKVFKYLKGEEIIGDANDGYGTIIINDIPLGGYKASSKKLKNHYPKGLRNVTDFSFEEKKP